MDAPQPAADPTVAPGPPAGAPAPLTGFRAVVPAGGAGTRLWPLSRAGRPKFLHDLTGTGRTLLQGTVDRLEPLTRPRGVLVVTGRRHEAAVREQLPQLGPGAVLAEPSPRDSMAAIGLAAAVLAHREGEDVVVGSFAADQVVGAGPAFAEAVRQGVVAARAGHVVTVGIAATGPSTAFGYVHVGEPLGLAGAPDARHVRGFTEKPDAARAAEYLATGRYRWNAGMFLVRAGVLLDHLARLHPELHAGLRRLAAAWDGPGREAELDAVWPGLEKIAIDHAIAEPVAAEGGVAVVPGDFPWDDVGDVASLAGLLPEGADGLRVLGRAADVVALDAPGSLVVPQGGRVVAVLGVPGVVVVDTPDAVLVTTPEHAQRLRSVVEAVAERRPDLL